MWNTVIKANATTWLVSIINTEVMFKPKLKNILNISAVTTDWPTQPKPREAIVIPN